MSLKELLHQESSFTNLPTIVKLIHSNAFPDSDLADVYQNIWSLLQGTYQQRIIGLTVLRCAIGHAHRTDRISENITMVTKWWRAVVSILRSRFTADPTYRLACRCAVLLSQISVRFVDLQLEAKSLIPTLTQCCASHVCIESLQLILILAQHYPTIIGKHYDEVRTMALARIHDEEYFCLAASILAQLSRVGSPGRQSCNYVQSWLKTCEGVFTGLNSLIKIVMGQSLEEGPVRDSSFTKLLSPWKYNGELASLKRACQEVKFLGFCFKALLKVSIDVPVEFPLNSFKCFLSNFKTFLSEVGMGVSTGENMSRKVFASTAAEEILELITAATIHLDTTIFIVQSSIETLITLFLQQRSHILSVVQLLKDMVSVGCVFSTLPYVSLIELLSLKSQRLSGPVTKKQKTEQFNSFSFESSSTGYHDIELMKVILELFMEIIMAEGLSLPTLNVELLKEKCLQLIQNENEFPDSIISLSYATVMVINSQGHNVKDNLVLIGASTTTARRKLFKEQMSHLEPHLHPERYSFRAKVVEVGELLQQDKVMSASNATLEDILISSMPHGTDVNQQTVDEGALRQSERTDEADVTMETDITEDNDSSDKENESEDKRASEIQSFVAFDEINEKFEKIKSSKPTLVTDKKNPVITDTGTENENSAELDDILSAFVPDPTSDDES